MAVRRLRRAVALGLAAPLLALSMATCQLPQPRMPQLTVEVATVTTAGPTALAGGR